MVVKLDVDAPLELDKLVDFLLRLALGVEVGVVVTVATLVRKAKTGLLGCVLYRSCGSDEVTQDHST